MTIEQKHQSMGEQPIFTCKAHVFHIDPKTKRSWLPASSSAVSVSFFYDSTRMLYRIISVEGTKAVINSTVTPAMTFTKTSQKFGQWSDLRANTVYGLGFPNEAELNVFIEKFNEVKAATIDAAKAAATNGGMAPVQSGPIPVQANVPMPPPGMLPRAPSPIGSAGTSISETSMLNVHVPGEFSQRDSSSIMDGSATMPKGGLSASSPAAVAHQRSHSLSGVQADSPKKLDLNKGLPPGATVEAQLKYENERLKLALAQSSANAKKWEVELQTLKNNNVRLTSALQESTANVEEWKRQLQSYKEENQRLKSRIIEIEAGRGNPEAGAEMKKEISLLKSEVESLSGELRVKDEEMRQLNRQLSERSVSGESGEAMKNLQMENEKLRQNLEKLQQQLETAITTQESQRRVYETLTQQLGLRLKEIDGIHREMAAGLQT